MNLADLTDSIIAALEANLPATTAVGDSKAPEADFPHVVVHSGITNAERSRGLSAGEPAVIDAVYQFDCVGLTRKSREITAALVRAIVLDESNVLGGASIRVSNRTFLVSSIDDDPDLHTYVEQVRVSMWASPT